MKNTKPATNCPEMLDLILSQKGSEFATHWSQIGVPNIVGSFILTGIEAFADVAGDVSRKGILTTLETITPHRLKLEAHQRPPVGPSPSTVGVNDATHGGPWG